MQTLVDSLTKFISEHTEFSQDVFGAVITTRNFAQILCMFLSVSDQYRSFYRLICSSRRFLAHILSAQVEN